MIFFRIITVMILLLVASQAIAARTDVIVLVNGNAVTGEIESLDFGALEYGTDSMGTVNVDWEDIVSITSNQQLQVEVTDGRRYFGNLESSEERFHINVITLSGSVELSTDQIIRITPIHTNERFRNRLEGDISFGLDTQKSTQVSTLNFASDIAYRTQKYLVGLQLNTSETYRPSDEDPEEEILTERSFYGSNYQRFRANRWFTDWYGRWERNDELGIHSRTTAGGGLGRYLVQNNTHQFSLTAGLQAARESFTGTDDSTTNAEGRIRIRYLHRSLDPESSLTFTSEIFPLLEDFSQFRAETDLSFKREFIKDLYFEVLFYNSYISDPSDDGASTDYGLTTSLGYSF